MRIRTIFYVLNLIVFLSAAAIGSAQTVESLAQAKPAASVGSIKIVHGEVFILRDGKQFPAAVGNPVQVRDVVRTGLDGSVGLVLRDDTALSLGPLSELALKAFTFQPNEGLFGALIGMVKGSLVYISGRISKLAPGSVKLETPVGIVAVRGTKLLIRIAG
jgi:hypothetical protein